jgi:hypothetical protein
VGHPGPRGRRARAGSRLRLGADAQHHDASARVGEPGAPRGLRRPYLAREVEGQDEAAELLGPCAT